LGVGLGGVGGLGGGGGGGGWGGGLFIDTQLQRLSSAGCRRKKVRQGPLVEEY